MNFTPYSPGSFIRTQLRPERLAENWTKSAAANHPPLVTIDGISGATPNLAMTGTSVIAAIAKAEQVRLRYRLVGIS